MLELTLPQPVLFVLQRLLANDFDAYVVGGAVRDTIMGRATADWDFTTNATPEEIQRIFPESFYDNVYGTVGVAGKHLFELMAGSGWQVRDSLEENIEAQDEVFEITTYRTEVGYSDRRRPDKVVWGTSILEDLARRDFTINAIALTFPGKTRAERATMSGVAAFALREEELTVSVEIIDPFAGKTDIDSKLIRAVGDAQERFDEDALRMMRAIRFGAQLGFLIETETMTAVNDKAAYITRISWERIRDELLKILASDYPADGVLLLHSSGLLEHILPELLFMKNVKQGGHHIYDVWTHSVEALRHCPSTDPIVRLATLLHDVGKPKTQRMQGPRGVTFYGHEVVGARMVEKIGERLRLPKRDVERLVTLVRWHMFVYNPEMTDASIRRFIRRVGLDNINDMLLLRVGDRKGGGSKATSWRLQELQRRIGEQLYEPMSLKDMKINGTDVMKLLEIPPGKKVGEILTALFEEVIEDTTRNNAEYLTQRAKDIYQDLLSR